MIGNFFMSFAYAKWMVPNQFVNGGVTSISMILDQLTPFSVVFWTNTVTGILLAISFIFLGKGNFFRAIISSLSYTFFFSFWYMLPFNVAINPIIDLILASLVIAFGYFSCIVADASVVGLDVIALIIHKKYPKTNIAHLIRYANFLVLGVGLLVYNIAAVIFGLLISIISTTLLNQLLKKYYAVSLHTQS